MSPCTLRRCAVALFAAVVGLAAALPALAGSRVAPVASYRIDVRWDEGRKVLSGKETVTFVNRTSATYSDLVLHLYLNAFRDDSSTFRRGEPLEERFRGKPESYGSVEVTRLVLASGEDLTRALAFVSPDDGNESDRTLARVPLPRPVAPGEMLAFTVEFVSHLPRNGDRTGWQDDFVFAGQWFPKLAKATERGWAARQFFSATEFFADFGDYDVTVDAPAAWSGKVAASGVSRAETPSGEGRVRFSWDAPDVHDFAFAACPRCEVHRQPFEAQGLPRVEISLLLQPDHRRSRSRFLDAVARGLDVYGRRYGPYPYPALSIVDPPFGSLAEGMEYPNLFTAGAHWITLPPTLEQSPEYVVLHELAHQWFQGMVATNEADEAHLDEGLTRYASERLLFETWGDPRLVLHPLGLPVATPLVRSYPEGTALRLYSWLRRFRSDASLVPTFSQADALAARVNAYERPSLLYAAAERSWGKEAWDAALRSYATRWVFRHPTTADFLEAIRGRLGDAAARAIGGALAAPGGTGVTVATAATVATVATVAAVESVESRPEAPPAERKGKAPIGSWESTALLLRTGDAPWPVDVELRFAGGHVVKRTWDGATRWIRYRATGPRLLAVVVDPGRKNLLDDSPLDDARSVEPDPAPATGLSRRLRFLAQALLEAAARLAAASILWTAVP